MKKKILTTACAWLICLGHAFADDLFISNVTIPQGGSTELAVEFSFASTTDKVGFTFSLGLPEGISLEKDGDGEPVYEKDASINKINVNCAGEGNFAGLPSNENATIKGSEGKLFTLTIKADGALKVGSTHTVSVTKVTFQEKVEGSVKDINIPDFTFTVSIGEPTDTRTILDETSTTAPEAATGVNVRVRRTINANEWSTICLPFEMTATQVSEAFGSDVRLGDFTGCEVDNVTGDIKVKFSDATAIEANHPYIIKVGTAVTEFTADGVDIVPEDEPAIDQDEVTTGTGRNKVTTYNSFIGNYVNGTAVPDYAMFLYDNKFYFSTGSTKIKAFRGYFDFATAGAEYDAARAIIVFDSEVTGVVDIEKMRNFEDENVYDLGGRQIGKHRLDYRQPLKGLYIRNGKKIIR